MHVKDKMLGVGIAAVVGGVLFGLLLYVLGTGAIRVRAKSYRRQLAAVNAEVDELHERTKRLEKVEEELALLRRDADYLQGESNEYMLALNRCERERNNLEASNAILLDVDKRLPEIFAAALAVQAAWEEQGRLIQERTRIKQRHLDRRRAARKLFETCCRVPLTDTYGLSFVEVEDYVELMRRDIARTGSLSGRYEIRLTPEPGGSPYAQLTHAQLGLCLDELMQYAVRFPNAYYVDGQRVALRQLLAEVTLDVSP